MIQLIFLLLFFFLVGFVFSGAGSIPVSATNVAVVTTALEDSKTKSMQIVYGAAIGTTVLSFIALFYHRLFTDYFEENLWLQITLLVFFFFIGFFIIFGDYFNISFGNPLNNQWKISNFYKGVLLSFANPQALIFWILVLTLVNTYLLTITKESAVYNLLSFFIGVFLGRISVLYLISKMGKKRKEKNSDNSIVYKIIGIALMCGTLFQAGRMLIE